MVIRTPCMAPVHGKQIISLDQANRKRTDLITIGEYRASRNNAVVASVCQGEGEREYVLWNKKCFEHSQGPFSTWRELHNS